MDLLIEKGTTSVKLSEYDFYNIAIEESAPEISLDHRSVTGRNGMVFGGATFTTKQIKVTGRVSVATIQDFFAKQDDVTGLLLSTEPFYITKMYPNNADLYNYQKPGQTTGDLDLIGQAHTACTEGNCIALSHARRFGKSQAAAQFLNLSAIQDKA